MFQVLMPCPCLTHEFRQQIVHKIYHFGLIHAIYLTRSFHGGILVMLLLQIDLDSAFRNADV